MEGDMGLDGRESGAAAKGVSWGRPQRCGVPSRPTIVSGVLLRLCVLLLHWLQRCTLAIQRSLSTGEVLTSSVWAGGGEWWLLATFMCCHMWGGSCLSATRWPSGCVLVLELRLMSIVVHAGSLLCGGPAAITTSMELRESEKMGAPSSSSSTPAVLLSPEPGHTGW